VKKGEREREREGGKSSLHPKLTVFDEVAALNFTFSAVAFRLIDNVRSMLSILAALYSVHPIPYSGHIAHYPLM